MEKDEITQLGKTFKSSSEMEAHLKANKLEMVDKDWVPPARIQETQKKQALQKLEKNIMKELSQHSHVDTGGGNLVPLR